MIWNFCLLTRRPWAGFEPFISFLDSNDRSNSNSRSKSNSSNESNFIALLIYQVIFYGTKYKELLSHLDDVLYFVYSLSFVRAIFLGNLCLVYL